MDFAEDVLQALELGAPRFIASREKAFDGVAEFFDADAQGVPGVRLLLANGTGVEALGFFEAFESEAFGGKAAGGDQADAFSEFAVEALPGFFVELFGGVNYGIEQAGLACAEVLLEKDAQAVVLGAVGFDPVAHDLRVAQRAEAAKEFSGKVAEFAPKRVGIDFRHYGGDGAAAADGHAKIVDGVFVWSATQVGELGENATNPMLQAAMLAVSTGKGSDAGHAMPRRFRRCRCPGMRPLSDGNAQGNAAGGRSPATGLWKTVEKRRWRHRT